MIGDMERPQTRRGSSQAGYYQDGGGGGVTPAEPSSSDNRPATRSGDYGAGGMSKPPIAQRFNSSAARPPTSSGFEANGSVGLTHRISTVHRPGSRAGTAVTSSAIQPIRTITSHGINAAAERPTTQQGLGGLKTATRAGQRQIQDKSYYLGLLRSKMSELNGEMARLARDIDRNNKEQQSLPSLEKKVKDMAVEITELQGQAADLNVLQEKIATSSDPSQMDSEYQSLVSRNEKDGHELETVFDDVKSAKDKVSSLERQIQSENDNAERFITTLPSADQAKYAELRAEQDRLAREVENRATQLAELDAKIRQLEHQIASVPAKVDMVRLRQTASDLEAKYEQMNEKESNQLNPDEEKVQLLAAVKADNAKVAAMEQQINDITAQIERLQNEIGEIDSSFEESQSERGQKYRDLRKREHVMDEFLETWQDNWHAETERLVQLEAQIVVTLHKLAKQHSLMQLLPTIADYSNAKEDLMIKEGELDKSKATLEGIALEYQRLQANLQKMEDLEGKIHQEMGSLKEQLAGIRLDSAKFASVDKLRRDTEDRRNDLIVQQQELAERKRSVQTQVSSLQAQFDQLQAQLDSNETHGALHVLDEKLRLIAEDNESMRSFVGANRASHDVGRRRQTTMETVHSYMKSLQAKATQI